MKRYCVVEHSDGTHTIVPAFSLSQARRMLIQFGLRLETVLSYTFFNNEEEKEKK